MDPAPYQYCLLAQPHRWWIAIYKPDSHIYPRLLFWVDGVVRIGEEEAVLVEKFGDNYHDYLKRTGRFLPEI